MIRQMKQADLPLIKNIMQSIQGFWHESWTDDTLQKAFNSSNDLSFISIDDNGEIEGFIFAHDFGFRAYISELAVVEAKRGYGIGKTLLEFVEEILREKNCELIIADVWKSAEYFYKKQGWVEPKVLLLKKDLYIGDKG